METLIYALGFIIGALGTLFLLYYLKTRKLLRLQHELLVAILAMASDSLKLFDAMRKEPARSKPCDNAAEPARQDPGNTAGPCAE